MSISYETGITRLNHLMDTLLEVELKQSAFDMDTWARKLRVPLPSDFADESFLKGEELTVLRANECGTACCVAGWGGTNKHLQEQGLKLLVIGKRDDKSPIISLEVQGNDPSFFTELGDDDGNLNDFFKLTRDQGLSLFAEINIEDRHGVTLRREVLGSSHIEDIQDAISMLKHIIQMQKDSQSRDIKSN